MRFYPCKCTVRLFKGLEMPWLNFLAYASRTHWTTDAKCRNRIRWLYCRMQQTTVWMNTAGIHCTASIQKTQQACLLFFSKSSENNYQHFTYSSDSYLMMKYFRFASTTFPWKPGRIWPKLTKLFLIEPHKISLTASATVCVWKNK